MSSDISLFVEYVGKAFKSTALTLCYFGILNLALVLLYWCSNLENFHAVPPGDHSIMGLLINFMVLYK